MNINTSFEEWSTKNTESESEILDTMYLVV